MANAAPRAAPLDVKQFPFGLGQMRTIQKGHKAPQGLHRSLETAIAISMASNQRGSSFVSLLMAALISFLVAAAVITYGTTALNLGAASWTRANLEEARAKLRLHIGCSQLKETLATPCVPGTTLALKDKNNHTIVLPDETTTISGKRIRAVCSAPGDRVEFEYQAAGLAWKNLFHIPFVCAEPSPTPTPPVLPTDHIIFITSTTHKGNFGGLAQADAECQRLATTVGLRTDRPWKAVISSSSESALSRLPIIGPIKDVNGNVVASNGSAIFTSGTLDRAVNYQENGVIPGSTLYTWTGSLQNGTASTTHCSNWTSSSANGTRGKLNASTANWINDSTEKCDSSRRLYCMSF